MKSKAEIEDFNKLMIQAPKLLNEFQTLSKKKPDDAVNKFKLNLVNRILTSANDILDDKNKPFSEFELFDEDSMPSNSDVVLILSQYLACLNKFVKENQKYISGSGTFWIINGKISSIKV